MKKNSLLFIIIFFLISLNLYSKNFFGTIDGKFFAIKNSHNELIRDFGSEIIGFYKRDNGSLYIFTKNSGIFLYENGVEFKEISTSLPKKNIAGKLQYRNIVSFSINPKNDSVMYVATKYYLFYTKNMGKSWEKYDKKKFWDITAIAVDFDKNFIAVGTSITGLYIKRVIDSTFFRIKPKFITNTLTSYETVSFLKIYNNNLYFGFNFNNFLLKSNIDSIYVKNDKLELNAKTFNFMDVSSRVAPHNSPYWLEFKNNKYYLASYNNFFMGSSLNRLKPISFPFFDNVKNSHISSFIKDDIVMNNLKNLEMFSTLFKDSLKLKASNIYSIYLPVHKINTLSKAKVIVNSIKNSKINGVVVDLKDDFGYIRYNSKLDIVQKVRSRRSKIKNLKLLLDYLHKNNIYFIARLVSFKDPMLARYSGRKYGIYNWKGDSAYYNKKESWVDPYSDFVHSYIISIAKELENLGVDEIQFDYIRFPTDFLPKKYISYRFKKPNMTNRDAIESFLKKARDSLKIPISTDIYGGSGWYNKSTGVGQELDMLKEYVDVICPMYYPSHFDDKFLNYAPYEKRPYRIYYQGVKRARELSSHKILVRPYVQAFNLKCCSRYDRKYYGVNYIKEQLNGCENANSFGYGFWNAAGAYKILKKLYNAQLKK